LYTTKSVEGEKSNLGNVSEAKKQARDSPELEKTKLMGSKSTFVQLNIVGVRLRFADAGCGIANLIILETIVSIKKICFP
jgi:hypothetical protein